MAAQLISSSISLSPSRLSVTSASNGYNMRTEEESCTPSDAERKINLRRRSICSFVGSEKGSGRQTSNWHLDPMGNRLIQFIPSF